MNNELNQQVANNEKKTLASIKYSLNEHMHTTVVTFEDNSQVYIFVCSGMIFVADCDYATLSERIENDETDTFESYDTIDLADYYMQSEYAEYINSALLDISHRLL